MENKVFQAVLAPIDDITDEQRVTFKNKICLDFER
jgi:hypothetical protein